MKVNKYDLCKFISLLDGIDIDIDDAIIQYKSQYQQQAKNSKEIDVFSTGTSYSCDTEHNLQSKKPQVKTYDKSNKSYGRLLKENPELLRKSRIYLIYKNILGDLSPLKAIRPKRHDTTLHNYYLAMLGDTSYKRKDRLSDRRNAKWYSYDLDTYLLTGANFIDDYVQDISLSLTEEEKALYKIMYILTEVGMTGKEFYYSILRSFEETTKTRWLPIFTLKRQIDNSFLKLIVSLHTKLTDYTYGQEVKKLIEELSIHFKNKDLDKEYGIFLVDKDAVYKVRLRKLNRYEFKIKFAMKNGGSDIIRQYVKLFNSNFEVHSTSSDVLEQINYIRSNLKIYNI